MQTMMSRRYKIRNLCSFEWCEFFSDT